MTDRDGRSAPWARALGVLLAPIILLILVLAALFLYGQRQEDNREKAAREETVSLARRFADDMAARTTDFPRDQRAAYQLAIPYRGTVFGYQRQGTTAGMTVKFSASYELAGPHFGGSTGQADVCYVLVFHNTGSPGARAVTRQPADKACSTVSPL
ncbi:hypothetical protein ACIBI4_04620 [Streptomyces sp. NPDC050418]|uniref:hypothetical protein n=1 Tax=Streptomyces sp. NPDC050418 TaxID=3365612 RepID=UPI0037B01A68